MAQALKKLSVHNLVKPHTAPVLRLFTLLAPPDVAALAGHPGGGSAPGLVVKLFSFLMLDIYLAVSFAQAQGQARSGQVEAHHGGSVGDNGLISAIFGRNFEAAVHHPHFTCAVG